MTTDLHPDSFPDSLESSTHPLAWVIRQRWRVLVWVLVLTLLAGWRARSLALDAVPDITNVQVQINTAVQGYSPIEAEQRLSIPIENALKGLPQLESTRSLSRYGLSQVTAIFAEGSDIYFARQQILERLSALDLPAKPSLGPVSTGLGEIVMFTLESAQASPTALQEAMRWIIRPQLMGVAGVAEVNSIGGYEAQVVIAAKPDRLLAYGLTLESLERALQNNHRNAGLGYIERYGQQILLRSEGQFSDLAGLSGLSGLVVGQVQGSPVRLQEVAQVGWGHPLRTGAALVNGREAVLGTVFMRMGENSRSVAQAAVAKLQTLQSTLPKGMTVQVVYDRTVLVNQTLSTVQKNLIEGALLVVLVLLVLLGNVRAALMTALVIPLSMVLTFAGMVQGKVSANLMSLGAIDFGLLVDGAVILVENSLLRLGLAYQQQGVLSLPQRLQVVYASGREVLRSSLFGVGIITVVYLPLFSFTGVEGKLFQPMALTVVLALICALVLSLTLIPALVAIGLTQPITAHETPIMRLLTRSYRRALAWVFQQKAAGWVLLPIVAGWLWFSASLLPRLGSEFLPSLDEGDIALHALRIPGTSLSQAVQMQSQLEAVIQQQPEVLRVFSKIGTAEVATDPMPPSVADTFIVLKDRQHWPQPNKPKAKVVEELATRVAQVPGNNYEFTQPIQMRFNELLSGVRAEIAIKVFGDHPQTLLALGQQVAERVEKVAGAVDVALEPVTGLPMRTYTPKREALARYGVSLAQIEKTLQAHTLGLESAWFTQGDRRYPIVLKTKGSLEHLRVPLDAGGWLPIAEVLDFREAPTDNQINRENGQRRVVITANVRGQDLGTVVQSAQQRLADLPLPAGYRIEYGGTYQSLQAAQQRLTWVVPATLLLVFGLLYAALRRFTDASLIFLALPLALTGGVWALWLRGIPWSVSAAVGFIALSGIAVLNGLVLVSRIRDLHSQGFLWSQAVHEGAVSRLRPVLMTALVAALGFIPMAFNQGIGSEVQRPLATVVIGGIFTATLLTLWVLPVLLSLTQWFQPLDSHAPALS